MTEARNFQKDDRLSFRCQADLRKALEKAAKKERLSLSAMTIKVLRDAMIAQSLMK